MHLIFVLFILCFLEHSKESKAIPFRSPVADPAYYVGGWTRRYVAALLLVASRCFQPPPGIGPSPRSSINLYTP